MNNASYFLLAALMMVSQFIDVDRYKTVGIEKGACGGGVPVGGPSKRRKVLSNDRPKVVKRQSRVDLN